jgi:hypothetical protein
MGTVCCNHAPKANATQNATGTGHGAAGSQPEHSPTHPHRHGLNDRSEGTLRCLARVEQMSWERAAGSAAAGALSLPPATARK